MVIGYVSQAQRRSLICAPFVTCVSQVRLLNRALMRETGKSGFAVLATAGAGDGQDAECSDGSAGDGKSGGGGGNDKENSRDSKRHITADKKI